MPSKYSAELGKGAFIRLILDNIVVVSGWGEDPHTWLPNADGPFEIDTTTLPEADRFKLTFPLLGVTDASAALAGRPENF